MKVIIFGGSGFLGQQIAKILVQRRILEPPSAVGMLRCYS